MQHFQTRCNVSTPASRGIYIFNFWRGGDKNRTFCGTKGGTLGIKEIDAFLITKAQSCLLSQAQCARLSQAQCLRSIWPSFDNAAASRLMNLASLPEVERYIVM